MVDRWIIAFAILICAVLVGFRTSMVRPMNSIEVMRVWADHNWSMSTTSLPISRSSVLAKNILSKNFNGLPSYLHVQSDTVQVSLIRRYINQDRYKKLRKLCPSAGSCDVITPDPVYKLTPMHMASLSGDQNSIDYLLSLGANPDAIDASARKPANLTFSSFIENTRRFAKQRGSACQLPEVIIDPENPLIAFAEIRRLVDEGEPVAIRGLLQYMNESALLDWNLDIFLKQFGNVQVKVGSVPYSSYFGLESAKMALHEYVSNATDNTYVFNKDPEISADAMSFLDRFVTETFPKYFTAPRVLGDESIHFYLGQKGSGAPYHQHSDAVNLLTHGKKRWMITPPNDSAYSRVPIHDYVESSGQIPALTCEQYAGDAFYVPFDWGHAVLNLEDYTFGFALELLNDRDSYRFLT
uniref:JmjC domain-containing protein n=1 Tax=Spongospora subterranea TaxID=70186 RepID=A0A0H5R404_9EUKA|eukprot:CRZ08930.1 hypothetical protein [Spongospora subterranea]